MNNAVTETTTTILLWAQTAENRLLLKTVFARYGTSWSTKGEPLRTGSNTLDAELGQIQLNFSHNEHVLFVAPPFVYFAVTSSHAHIISWLHQAPPSIYTKHATFGSGISELFVRTVSLYNFSP